MFCLSLLLWFACTVLCGLVVSELTRLSAVGIITFFTFQQIVTILRNISPTDLFNSFTHLCCVTVDTMLVHWQWLVVCCVWYSEEDAGQASVTFFSSSKLNPVKCGYWWILALSSAICFCHFRLVRYCVCVIASVCQGGSVCLGLFVGLSVSRINQKLWRNFHEIFWKGNPLDKGHLVSIWWWFISGSSNYFSLCEMGHYRQIVNNVSWC